MNRAYRLVWSRANNAWVVASEKTKGRGKSSGKSLSVLALSLFPLLGLASPIDGQVVSGIGTINQSGSLTTINQSSQSLVVNWKSFNIGSQETVNFNQPNAASIAVNRIYDVNGTQILGHLYANGQVWLINPNGILFGKGAQVNVGGLVASTLDSISNNGSSVSFSGSGKGQIVNEGTINGHYVALIGNTVTNNGTIAANLGTAALGAGSSVTLTFSGNDLVHMQVDKGVLNALVANGGVIQADGGYVIMTAGAKDGLLASVVNNTGIVRAETVQDRNGTITLLGGMKSGTVNVGGTLDASAPNGGNGGFIETSAAHVEVSNDAKVTTLASNGLTGSWLIDPQDYTIAASGGDITGSQLGTNLSTSNVTILSSSGATSGGGNINVNAAVSWSANTLTLTAANNIDVNAVMNAAGSASLALNPATANGADSAVSGGTINMGMSSAGTVNTSTGNAFTGQINFNSTGTVSIGGTPYTVINSLGSQGSTTGTDLQGIQGNLSGHYVLGSSIDATTTSTWNSGAGLAPIGSGSTTPFMGILDGFGHTVSNLTINRSSTNYVGLFGYTGAGSIVRNVGLAGGSVTGATYVGALVGFGTGSIGNSYVTDSVTGNGNKVGGLVGLDSGGIIISSYATGAVSGGSYVGGLVGFSSASSISNSYATGSVSGGWAVGGLVGDNFNNSTGRAVINTSYATGSVSGTASYAGGLVGLNNSISGHIVTIGNSYAMGTVTGGSDVGGLVGFNNNSTSSISNSYATGSVSGTGSYFGGLVGHSFNGTVSNSFWDTTTSGQSSSAGGTGLTTTQMQTQANFTSATSANGNVNPNWDFSTTPVWVFKSGMNSGYPVLCAFNTCVIVTTVYVDPASGSSVYGSTPSFSYALVNSSGSPYTLSNATVGGTAAYSGAPTATSSAGNYSFTYTSGLSLSGTGASNYTLASYTTASTWNVTKATLVVTGTAVANKVYDGTTAAALSGGTLVGVIGTDSVILTQAGNFTSKNVGNGIAATASDSISGSAAGNYNLTQPTGLSANITPASLTVTGESAQSKVYDGTTTATLSGGSFVGVIGTDSVTLTQAGSFASKSVGNSIAVTASDSISGTAAGNYTLTQPTGLSANITPATLTVTHESAQSKVYDGTTNATLSGGYLWGVVSGDAVSLTQSGNFASRNVGNGVTVNASDSISGASASNYTFTQPTGLTANITPVTLTYNATASSLIAGQTPSGLTGTVSGFVSGDTLLNSTTGTLTWSTTATSISQPGQYSIDGSGLSAVNYVFAQTPSNATALTLKPGSLPEDVQHITTQQDSNFSQTAGQPLNQNPSTTITPTNSQSTSGSGSGQGTVVNADMSIGGSGSLHIVNGGTRLPDNVVGQNTGAMTEINLNQGLGNQ